MNKVYPGLIMTLIDKFFRSVGVGADQHQTNGCWCAHQMRVRLPGDPTTYRLIVAPADAPVMIGDVSADAHFGEPLVEPGKDVAA